MLRVDLINREDAMSKAMGHIGDGWSMMTIWATLNGTTRFDELQNSLGVARNILSARLKRLVALELLERRPLIEGAKRCEYVPTEKARLLYEPLKQISEWGEFTTTSTQESASSRPIQSLHQGLS